MISKMSDDFIYLFSYPLYFPNKGLNY